MPVAKPRRSEVTSCFAFINVTRPDEIRQRSTQRAIRSGAMAAIGRARRKRPEKPVIVELNMPHTEVADGGVGDGLGTGVPATLHLYSASPALQSVPPALPNLGVFAIEPDKRARELLHFMSGEASLIYRPFRLEWFYMALLDPSSYYLCLANAALFMDQQVTRRTTLEYTDSVESTKYYSKCLTRLTRQLACQIESISEGAITTILGFVCHSFSTGDWNQCEMHMQGLARIIRLRGGFQGLSGFSPLFASWFDTTNSAVQDIQPRLSYPEKIVDWPAKLEELPSNLIHLLARLESTGFSLVCLRDGLRQTAQLASYVNRHAQQPEFWKAGVKATRLVGPAAHCVLFIPRLDLLSYLDDDESCLVLLLQEIVRLALLILLATLKRNFSLIADELGLFLERFLVITPLMVGCSFFPELRLWAYLVAACAREDTIPQIQMSEIRRAMRDLQIQKTEDAVTVAKNIIWIHSLLNRKIERVKEQIDQHFTASDSTD